MNEDDFLDYLLQDYLDDESELSSLLDNIKEWGRKIPPLLVGTVASAVLSNPTFIGIGGIILILQEIGIDIHKLRKLDRSNNLNIPVLSELNNYSNKKSLYKDDKSCLNRVLYEIDMILDIYEMELDINEDELKVILENIINLINNKGFNNLKYEILSYYYKKSIAAIIYKGHDQMDYYDFMNGINYLLDIDNFNKKDIKKLSYEIIKQLNKGYKDKKINNNENKIVKFR